MRGKPPHFVYCRNDRRITPAGAGKTQGQHHPCRKRWDHPRRCGENQDCPPTSTWRRGSPPRMRGKHLSLNPLLCGRRITPADAGKTVQHGNAQRRKQDHPRGCGENCFAGLATSRAQGSPPRMRGKPVPLLHELQEQRITPADAGKTSSAEIAPVSAEDHPRGCGENDFKLKSNRKEVGSPPRMRGKLSRLSIIHAADGITPADAGKT